MMFFILAAGSARAQSGRPAPTPTPPLNQDQEPIKVFTEEVRLAVIAVDQFGHFDPTLGAKDILIQEDGVPQEIASVRRIPASVLMLLGTGGGPDPAMRTTTTRAVALRLLHELGPGDRFAVIQFGNKVEEIQDWTDSQLIVEHTLANKLHSGNGSLLAPAIKAAAAKLQSEPVGNRQLLLVTDGVDFPDGRATYQELLDVLRPGPNETAARKAEWDDAVKDLMAAQVTVHIISYANYAKNVYAGRLKESRKIGVQAPPDRPAGSGPMMPGHNAPAMGVSFNFDPQMRKLRKAYEEAMKTSEPRLISLADETGAKLRPAGDADEMIAQAEDVAREIGAQYVVTYLPKKPLSASPPGEYRRIQISARRAGLVLRTRRGYVVTRPK